ncbi:hypothetical protein SAMN02745166_03821 [Prosthecobacter debontii]|uniref:Uncharacterized protein n=1 Tax=Prosthecobacter debontii TaxID=48467 RepID=A0A1T4YNS2_9BACT|nr:hypothetical protein SAMN02745166_03821 [Prosthecobacter debontii]
MTSLLLKAVVSAAETVMADSVVNVARDRREEARAQSVVNVLTAADLSAETVLPASEMPPNRSRVKTSNR